MTPLARRIEAALKDGRIPQALELSRQLVRQEPGPAAHALQRKCYLAAAEAQVGRGAFRDAHAVLTEAEKLACDDPAWWVRLAELRADLGDSGRALQLLEKAPGRNDQPRILARVADRALREGPAGREMLPADLRPQFDVVRQAFADYEAGRDDPAREKLNAIGLTSPFLDWKLFLRGLTAWSAGDSVRAAENWSRLSADRLPARLADPFRIEADKTYAANLPAARLAQIARQSEGLARGVSDGLRRLRKQLASEGSILEALETARVLVPEINRVAPDLVPRLGNVVYWTLAMDGQPDDVPRYNRIFGTPADDPQLFRLQALIWESMGALDKAHQMWGRYEDWIAKTPARWPGPQGPRARALVLERMGRLARDWLNDAGDGDGEDDFFGFLDSFMRNERRRPRMRVSLQPSAEECFRKSGELAPDWITPAMSLLQEYRNDPSKAYPAVAAALERFPSDLTVLESAAEFYERIGDMPKAHDCIKRALAANPLDRELRRRGAGLALNDARRRAADGDFDAARASLREAADLGDGPASSSVLAVAAAIELRARNAEAFQTHRDALLNIPDGRLAGAYRLMVEGSRLKLKKKDLGPYQAAFADGLAAPLTVTELVPLLDAVAEYQQEPIKYRGLQSHARKVIERVIAVGGSEIGEDDLLNLALTIENLHLYKPLQVLADIGVRRYPTNAYFHYFEAESMLSRRRSGYVNYNIGMAYSRVKRFMAGAQDGRYRRLQEMLDERVKKTPELRSWLDDRQPW
jgi:tetratricopeptide (TPR) repeat protein